MKLRRSGVFLPMKNSSERAISPMPATLTCPSRMEPEMKGPNSCGLISPRPLKRVISWPRIYAAAVSRSASEKQ